MTPALLFALEQQHEIELGKLTFPTDKLAWIYANSQRDQGERDENGVVTRQASPVLSIELFRTYGQKARSLVTKEPEWDYSLLGARADKGSFESWAEARLDVEYTPTRTKEN